ncbi:MAG: DUF2652 domain-containing protein [Bacteroidota bacterium]
MSDTTKAVLLVADISGFTNFMRQHVISVNHAKQIVIRLLKSLMQTARPPLKVAELEGDAVFFYALSSEKDMEKVTTQVKEQMVKFFAAFKKEMDAINNVKTCVCDACDHVHDLKLKQVVHVGEVAVEKIDRFEKLFGMDVILVHRMLKNSVPSKEYVMMTNPVYERIHDFYGLEPERRLESFEGVGDVETLVFYPAQLPHRAEEAESVTQPASFSEKTSWRMWLSLGFVLDFLRISRIKGAFNNFPA